MEVETVVCDRIVRLLNAVLQSNYDKLGQVLQGSMSDFANKMFEKALITDCVKDTCTFKAIIQDFKAACGCITDISAIEKHIFSFLTVLEDLGGPPSTAGLKLERNLKASINMEIPNLSEFLVRSKPGKSHSTPLATDAVYITAKLDRKRYSEGHKFVTPDKTEQMPLTRQNTSNSGSSNYDNAIYSQADEEEDFKVYGRNNSSEFASSTRPRPLPDPKNPILPGTSTTGSTHPTAQSLPITNDSGIPPSKRNSPDGTNNYRQLRYKDRRPVADTYNPSEPVSDTNDIRESLSCRSMSSFNSDTSIANEFIDHLKKDKTEQERKTDEAERKREEAERKREEADKKCFDLVQLENQFLKNELNENRKHTIEIEKELKQLKQKLKKCDRQQTIMEELKKESHYQHQNKLRENNITMQSKCNEIATLKEENKLLRDSHVQAMNEQEKKLMEQKELYESLIVRERNMVEEKEYTIVEKKRTIEEKERTIVEKKRTIVEKKRIIEEKERTIVEKEEQLKKRRKENTEYCQRLKRRCLFVVTIEAVLIFILLCINLYLIFIIY